MPDGGSCPLVRPVRFLGHFPVVDPQRICWNLDRADPGRAPEISAVPLDRLLPDPPKKAAAAPRGMNCAVQESVPTTARRGRSRRFGHECRSHGGPGPVSSQQHTHRERSVVLLPLDPFDDAAAPDLARPMRSITTRERRLCRTVHDTTACTPRTRAPARRARSRTRTRAPRTRAPGPLRRFACAVGRAAGPVRDAHPRRRGRATGHARGRDPIGSSRSRDLIRVRTARRRAGRKAPSARAWGRAARRPPPPCAARL